MPNKQYTRKKRMLIIESTSSKKSSQTLSERKRKRKNLIIESSTPSSLKEKIDSLNPDKLGESKRFKDISRYEKNNEYDTVT